MHLIIGSWLYVHLFRLCNSNICLTEHISTNSTSRPSLCSIMFFYSNYLCVMYVCCVFVDVVCGFYVCYVFYVYYYVLFIVFYTIILCNDVVCDGTSVWFIMCYIYKGRVAYIVFMIVCDKREGEQHYKRVPTGGHRY